MRTSSSRRLAVMAGALTLGVSLAVPASGLLFASASATPGHPGTPSAPTVVFAEGFGTGQAAGQVTPLASYDGGKYTADSGWLSAAGANGLVIDGTSTNAALSAAGFTSVNTAGGIGATQGDDLRLLATKLGQLNGTVPASANHAVTAYTDNNPGAGIEFETKNPIPVHVNGRFLTISANVAALNCQATHPELVFYLVNAGTAHAVNTTPLDPCQSNTSGVVYASTLIGGNATLFTGNAVGIQMRNQNGSGTGNDHAFDDVKVLDVTPQLDKTFVPSSNPMLPGDTAKLVFRVTNTSELGEKDGWSFTDKLAKGLKVAGAATSTCKTGSITAATGATSISVANGDLAAGTKDCTITVPVIASSKGTYENSAANITSVGLNAPAAAKISYVGPPSLKLVKSATPARISAKGQKITFNFDVTNNGGVGIRNIGIAEGSFSGTGKLGKTTCPTLAGGVLKPGKSIVCHATYIATAADVKKHTIRNTARATGTAPNGASVTSAASSAVVTVVTLPAVPDTGF